MNPPTHTGYSAPAASSTKYDLSGTTSMRSESDGKTHVCISGMVFVSSIVLRIHVTTDFSALSSPVRYSMSESTDSSRTSIAWSARSSKPSQPM